MKIFNNFLFRNILCGVIILASIFIPLCVLLPMVTTFTNRLIISLSVSAIAIIELVLYAFWEYKMTVSPIKLLNDKSKRLGNGEYDATQIIGHADSEVLLLEKSVSNIAEEFKNLEQMRKSFIANASHELRSPLTSMQGFLQAILDGTVPEEEREKYLQIVLDETRRLNTLINSMLDLSRMESNEFPLSPIRFDVHTVINQIIEKFEPDLIKKEIRINTDFAENVGYVFADKEKIVQVLVNLIDNAVKYSPPHSVIFVSTSVKDSKVYITVKDNGIGINKKEQLLIWDRFYMADKARTPNKSKGTGLGLSIVKRIIDAHKENVWVESGNGSGATFIFTLPLYDPAKHQSAETQIGG